ncbi:MAG: metallopeptidase family protein [Planctomycetota bacterium]|jgi:predicted Zn-dependent protease with MMP-like domain
MMDEALRDWFDELVDEVVASLPEHVHAMLDDVPLIVEDRASPQMLEALGLETDEGLAGMHSGVMLTDRSVEAPPVLPTQVYLFRLGVLDLVENLDDIEAIREQIRITILHELGHHVGLEEDDLDELGYA